MVTPPLMDKVPDETMETQALLKRKRAPLFSSENVIVALLLVAILSMGAYYRFVGQNWDDFTHLHPDERFLTQVAEGIGSRVLNLSTNPDDLDFPTREQQFAFCQERYPNTGGVGDFFDSRCTTWYPVNIGHGLYVYGELPLFTVRLTAELTKKIHSEQATLTEDTLDDAVAQSWTSYNGIHIVGRNVSAVAELTAVFFLFLIGRRLYNKWVGLLAAALAAAAVLPIQLSHFWTADAFTVLPVVVAFYFAVRAMDTGKFLDFIGFGIFMGAAIASRINVLPLIGVIGLAAIMHALPLLDAAVPARERSRVISKMALALALSVLFMLITFRFAMPHAFTGGPGILGILNVRPYPPWIDDVAEAQYLTSGRADIPPNHQWASRLPYGFAWWNMVAFGMGLPLGLMAWASFAWAGITALRARPGWTRHVLPVVWILVYFALMGRLWVMAMRYYIVIYPFLCLMAAWGLLELLKRARQAVRLPGAGTMRRFGYRAVSLLLVIVIGYTYLYAAMFTNGVFRPMLSRAYASHWVLRNVPSAMSTTLTLTDGRIRLFNLPMWSETTLQPGQPAAPSTFTAPADGTISEVNFRHIKYTVEGDTTGVLSVRFLSMPDNRELAAGKLELTDLTARTSIYGDPHTVKLDNPLTMTKWQDMQVAVTLLGGPPVQITGSVIATEGPWDDPVPQKVCALPLDMDIDRDTPSGLRSVADCGGVDAWGVLYKGVELYMAMEDADPGKRTTMQTVLDQADYITISSNRFYDSLSRIPVRFPMSMVFYDALFAGKAGFNLEQTFTGYPRITLPLVGTLEIPDQNLPTYNTPRWVNEFEAEESFHVYDHPAVFIFKKNDAYSSTGMAAILGRESTVDASRASGLGNDNDTLVNVIQWGAQPASAAPTAFKMNDDLRATQTNGGTYSALFGRDWFVNSSQVVSVAVFWLAIIAFGWIIFPTLYALFPGLADRGYGLAKIAGLLVVSWLVWVGGTLRLFTWSNWGILLTMAVVALFSLAVARRKAAEFRDYLRANWRHMLLVEMITLILFAAFLLVRLTNPDLWHPSFGGEKPMDFAYFNAVLRSTVFPPYDPWYAGGYLNYYYYGFVLVGTPVKLLGITPTVAYNLLVPMVFAVTGISAFSIAFNVVASRWFNHVDEGSDDRQASVLDRLRFALKAPSGSPYVAGVLAILLSMVLGNLHTPSVALDGVLRLGGCDLVYTLGDWKLSEFTRLNGRAPSPEEQFEMELQAARPSITDQIGYGAYTFQRNLACLGTGVGAMATGSTFPMGTNRWFWAARSVVGELPNSSNEINEFPIFTFIYGDLHAHMIAMPITLLALGWLLSEMLIAGRAARPTWAVIGATLLGGLAVGILFPTNTWDWITYLVLGAVGLLFTFWLRRDRLNRKRVLALGGQLLLFLVAQIVAAQPFRMYFASSYSSVRLFEGNKTPLWAYIDMHGLFLFVIVSFLVWQTARLLRHVYVRDFIGRGRLFLLLVGVIGIGALVTLFVTVFPLSLPSGGVPVSVLPIPIGLLMIPLLVWCVVLFLLPYQSRESRVLYAMIGLAAGLSLAVDVVVLEGDIARQNTFFKFYMQVWFLLSIAAAVMLAWLVNESRRWLNAVRVPWLIGVALLMAIGAMYPLLATQAKAIERFTTTVPATLDGMDYMRYAVHAEYNTMNNQPDVMTLETDWRIIRWLQDNVQGTPVILEARQYPSEYKWNARISINTGLPTIVGWNFHQKQQRTLDPLPTLVEQRANNVGFMYNSINIEAVWRTLTFYNVRYIVVGHLERLYYVPEGINKFNKMVDAGLLKVVYENGDDRVYEVIVGATPPATITGSLP